MVKFLVTIRIAAQNRTKRDAPASSPLSFRAKSRDPAALPRGDDE
jgi:hypothetical protein